MRVSKFKLFDQKFYILTKQLYKKEVEFKNFILNEK